MTCPYAVLGVSRRATPFEIKARYLELAKKHHPDRWAVGSDQDRLKNEQYFKQISSAYNAIITKENVSRDDSDWMSIWESFIRDENFQIICEFLKQKLSALQPEFGGEDGDRRKCVPLHTATINVTIEDIYQGRNKRIRVWIDQNPVSIQYPCCKELYIYERVCADGGDLIVKRTVLDHPYYALDTVGGTDLYHTRHITLEDYCCGNSWTIPKLGIGNRENEESIEYELKPFQAIDLPLIIEGHGLTETSNLIVIWKLDLPKNIAEMEEVTKISAAKCVGMKLI